MKIKNITTKEELDAFYNTSAFTIEGLSLDSLPDLDEWIKTYTPTDNAVYNIVSGSLMNKVYKLRGSNAYPADLHIVVITGIQVGNLIIPRFQIGGRWFDDVVDNNRRRTR